MFNAIWEAAANKVYVALIDTLATIITIIGDDDNIIKRKKMIFRNISLSSSRVIKIFFIDEVCVIMLQLHIKVQKGHD